MDDKTDKFNIENRPYFHPVPDVIYAPGRFQMVESIERRLPRLAKRLAPLFEANRPIKKKVKTVTISSGVAFKHEEDLGELLG